MATYGQWARTRALRKVTWVCGPEQVLVREVLAEFRRLDAPVRVYRLGGSQPEASVWDSLLAWPPGASLSVVYRAEHLRMPGRMAEALESIPDLSFAVFVSGEADFTRVPAAAGKQQLAPHLAALQAGRSGQLVRCAAPAGEERLLALVASWWPGAGLNFARDLLAACGGSLEAAWQACETAGRAGLPPGGENLLLACQQAPHARFADLVTAGEQKQAAELAGLLPPSGVLPALGLLSWRLGALSRLSALQDRGLEAGEIARKGIDRAAQRELGPHAARYGPVRAARCRQLLALAEDAARSGAVTGVLEAVAVLW